MSAVDEQRFKDLDTIYQLPNVAVKRCLDTRTGKTVCSKKILVENTEDLSFLIKEVITLFLLNKHEYFLKIIDYELIGIEKQVEYLRIITEYYSEGDLDKEITRRKKLGTVFNQDFLENSILWLLNGFKTLQDLNIAHRDIKPENIFLSEDGKLVIGDLGSATFQKTKDVTLIGTHHYLSPEVRKAFMDFHSGYAGPRVNYDPIKSDVWSLAVVIYYMITLEKPEKLSNMQELNSSIPLYLNKVAVPHFKELLSKMLTHNPLDREDFSSLFQFFSAKINRQTADPIVANYLTVSSSNQVCSLCKVNSTYLTCQTCRSEYHQDCVKRNRFNCPKCKNKIGLKSLNLQCTSCNQTFSGSTFNGSCQHILCPTCRLLTKDCLNCLGFYVSEQRNDSFDHLTKLSCPYCPNPLQARGKTLQCRENPNYKICIVCKSESHQGSCLLLASSEQIYCMLCSKYTRRLPFSFLVECDSCFRSYCYVCFQSISQVSHIRCSNLFCFS